MKYDNYSYGSETNGPCASIYVFFVVLSWAESNGLFDEIIKKNFCSFFLPQLISYKANNF